MTKTGGHLGWVCAEGGYRGEPWTDFVVTEWFLSIQVQLAAQGRRAAQAADGSIARSGAASPQTQTPTPTPQLQLQPSQAAAASAESAAVAAPASAARCAQAEMRPTGSYVNAKGMQAQLPPCALRPEERDVTVPVGSPLENAHAVQRFVSLAQGSEASVRQTPAGQGGGAAGQASGGASADRKYGVGAQASLADLQQCWADSAPSPASDTPPVHDAALSRHDTRAQVHGKLNADDLSALAHEDSSNGTTRHANGNGAAPRDASVHATSRQRTERQALQRKGWHSRLGSDTGSAITSTSSQYWWT